MKKKNLTQRRKESKKICFAWFPCSSVGTHMVCIPTLEHGNEKREDAIIRIDEFI
ncbi:MAG: hypothetical protein KAT52_09235 [Desulfobacterales bacterium]|nr:hypothetical protein [Desulfobacterales bacterium]MDL2123484.1 hypothetical protein [Deltaproteobacteria bacterium]